MVRRIFYLTTDGIWPFFNVIVLNTLQSLNRFNFLVSKYASQSNLSVLFCLISVFKCPALKFLPSPGCECWVLRKERDSRLYTAVLNSWLFFHVFYVSPSRQYVYLYFPDLCVSFVLLFPVFVFLPIPWLFPPVYLSSEFILCLLQVLIWGFRFYRIFWIFLNLNFCFRWINCSLLFHLYVGKVLQHAVDEHYELYINPNKTTEGKLLLISALL